MPYALVSFQCLPLVSAPREALYRMVDVAIAAADRAGVPYMVGPTETAMEGQLDALLDIVREGIAACQQQGGGAPVATVVKIVTPVEPGVMQEEVAKYRATGH